MVLRRGHHHTNYPRLLSPRPKAWSPLQASITTSEEPPTRQDGRPAEVILTGLWVGHTPHATHRDNNDTNFRLKILYPLVAW
ncbi:hypothetical protein E2C01_014616 [Portunus trituberculatus]|uniref:Uncharacterized protein n=1 Tax=Portunus trituberculatus TaxID=210409 RepID=A0A5B7DKF4_PORTR|nr:hypothetical protein [Portunus trituberculatus]